MPTSPHTSHLPLHSHLSHCMHSPFFAGANCRQCAPENTTLQNLASPTPPLLGIFGCVGKHGWTWAMPGWDDELAPHCPRIKSANNIGAAGLAKKKWRAKAFRGNRQFSLPFPPRIRRRGVVEGGGLLGRRCSCQQDSTPLWLCGNGTPAIRLRAHEYTGTKPFRLWASPFGGAESPGMPGNAPLLMICHATSH